MNAPSYLKLSDKEFKERIAQGKKELSSCSLCGNNCQVDRCAGSKGKCDLDDKLKISSANLHFGEEPPISGANGSGTIFLTGCCLSCVFCQNYPISQLNNGKMYYPEDFAEKCLELQEKGVHNINFVSPTQQVPQLIEGIYEAKKKGLKIPIVYNTGGYDSLDSLKLLDGIIDIYLPDFKYADNKTAFRYSQAKDYVGVARTAIAEMLRQVGHIKIDEKGIAERGVIIRHLVLPNNIAQTKSVFVIIKEDFTDKIHASIMGQYFPAHKACVEGPDRKVTDEEYSKAIQAVADLGFENVFTQDLDYDPGNITSSLSLRETK